VIVLYWLLMPLLIYIITSLLQYLWNTTMPEVFRLNQITFWQAFRLILIALILFGGLNYKSLLGLLGILGMSHL
jgi:hypothetical protein